MSNSKDLRGVGQFVFFVIPECPPNSTSDPSFFVADLNRESPPLLLWRTFGDDRLNKHCFINSYTALESRRKK